MTVADTLHIFESYPDPFPYPFPDALRELGLDELMRFRAFTAEAILAENFEQTARLNLNAGYLHPREADLPHSRFDLYLYERSTP